MSFVRTVLGDLNPDKLGVCYAHEHLFIGQSWATSQHPEFLINSVPLQTRELQTFYEVGGRAAIDSMPCDCGRSAEALASLSRNSGVHIVAPTGIHLPIYYPPWHWSHRYDVEDLSRLFILDIERGIDVGDYNGPVPQRTGVKAGVIKVASGLAWGDREQRIFEAASQAHRETGCPILTHTEKGELALEQINCFRENGVDLRHVCLSHTDRKPDRNYHKEILSTGVRLEYDSAFRWKNRADNPTADLLLTLYPDFPDQLMLGMDMARKSYWRCHGGNPGLDFLISMFWPDLAARGMERAAFEKIFVSTPASTYCFRSKVQ